MNGDQLIEKWENNRKKLELEDEKAMEENKLVGRFVQEPYADGYAIYRVIRENKKSVRIRLVEEIGDSYMLPYWGKETTIDKDYALGNIGRRDRLNRMFSRKN